jgi:hypothetical protein
MSTVQGTVAMGYESVKELFAKVPVDHHCIVAKSTHSSESLFPALQNLANGADINSQLCVYVKGELVIDLWGSAAPSWKPGTGFPAKFGHFSNSPAKSG